MSSVRGIWEGFGREPGLEGRRIRLGELEVDLVLPGEAFGKNRGAQGRQGIEQIEHMFYH
jgi:hypothetical protein